MDLNSLDKFKFKSPTTACITGPTSCGKTHFVFEIIKNKKDMFTSPVTKVIYCYKVWQEKFETYLTESSNEDRSKICFHEGVYDISKHNSKNHILLIVDDLMHEIGKDLASIFCVHSHHKNVSVFFLNQNLFLKNKYIRDINLNTQYLIIFKQRRDLLSIRALASQIFPGQIADFIDIYNKCVSEPFSYLLIELHPSNIHRVLLRKNILPNEIETVYIPSE